MDLISLGWNDFFDQHFSALTRPDLVSARVVRVDRQRYQIYSAAGALGAGLAGRFRHDVGEKSDYPTVGDWVVVQPRTEEGRATIHDLLPRKSAFSRRAVDPGGRGGSGEGAAEQVIAANVDSALLVSGLDGSRMGIPRICGHPKNLPRCRRTKYAEYFLQRITCRF